MWRTLARYSRLYWEYLVQYAKVRWEYRGDLIVGLVSEVTYQAMSVVLIAVTFQLVPDLRGWTRAEVFFLYGYFLVPGALFGALAGGLWDVADKYVIKGEMDRVLIRPAHPLFQVILEGVELESLLGVATGIAIMAWAGERAGVVWDWADWLVAVGLILSSAAVYLGIYMALAATAFFADGRTGLMALAWNLNQYGQYPPNIFSRSLRWLLSTALPFLFVGAYPGAYLVRRGEWGLFAWLTPVVAAATVAFALWVWRRGLRRYTGAGS
ncbi:MAG: ABC-2 family transporter protein [Bacillota bacterium]|nr:MAG: ABC transporter permease [Bacillota bacterium]